MSVMLLLFVAATCLCIPVTAKPKMAMQHDCTNFSHKDCVKKFNDFCCKTKSDMLCCDVSQRKPHFVSSYRDIWIF